MYKRFLGAFALLSISVFANDFYDYLPPAIELVSTEESHPLGPPGPQLVDLDEKAQSFVLETKQIHIPGFPDAFNPSIIRWEGSLLMSFRIYNHQTKTAHQIGLVRLDDDFNLIGNPQILDMRMNDADMLMKRQDPRLIEIQGRLYIVYNNIWRIVANVEVRRMLAAEVFFDGNVFYTEKTTRFDSDLPHRSEKNWVPFVYQGNLLLSYSIQPHRVLFPNLVTGDVAEIASIRGNFKWDWGVLRGGSSALPVDGEYLAFFHSCENMATLHSKGKRIPHYFMGAYTFSQKPPFEVTRISPEPIFGPKFYNGTEYKTWKPVVVVFPGGYTVDENYIWVVYGRQDHEVWVVKLDRKGLFESLVPVKPAQ